jgi:peptide methionine sulfoxide reductase msrA/msrB
VIFYANDGEKAIAEELIATLERLGYEIATRVEPRTDFYRAEGYHQDYYEGNRSTPYCHVYTKRFPD